ncbi:MAG TPA: hypothetical protein PKV13_02260 [Propionicimonas sp.]|nr:hypothetical protein [Propionicimonas sp.]HRA05425.1 hypothetical protein [Propionicimonas sp.]
MDGNTWRESAQQASHAIGRAVVASAAEEVVAELSEAGRLLDDAQREAMAAAVLDGTSMRKVAEIAGLAPNSVPPRLARSKSLRPYAADGGITAADIAVARYDAAAGRPPMAFKPRRKDQK